MAQMKKYKFKNYMVLIDENYISFISNTGKGTSFIKPFHVNENILKFRHPNFNTPYFYVDYTINLYYCKRIPKIFFDELIKIYDIKL
jgi:hypothetical protein